jgi:hypothetical protein
LAGARANKHRPVARQTRVSDLAVARREQRAWFLRRDARLMQRDDCWDFARLLYALAALEHDPALGSKPDHPFRAVNIDACFGARLPLRDSARELAARRAGDCGRSGATMTVLARLDAYALQRGMPRLTPRQDRRVQHKARRCGEWAA